MTLSLPILPVLQEIIAASPTGHQHFSDATFGKPFARAGFGYNFRQWCDELALLTALLTGCVKLVR